MSRFGWAYVNSLVTGAVANGPTNSVQFNSGSQVLSGSSNFTFDPATSTLIVTGTISASVYQGISTSATPAGSDQQIQFNSGSSFGASSNLTFDYSTNTLYLTGTLRADNLVVSSSQILKSGSTIFGDDASDTHQFTGSILGGIVSGTTAQFTTITGSNIQTNGISLTGALLMSGTSGQSYISEVDYIDFDVSASIPAYKAARIFHDTNTNDLSYYLALANQALQIGQQTVVKVKNSSGSPIAKGKLVQITGGVGDNPLINTASWENDNNSANTLGMLMSTVADGEFGYALLNGVLTGVNTDPATYSEGQVIYLSSSGDYTNVTPIAPNHTVRLGQVVRAHAVVGSVFIKIDNGYEIDELHNVLITSASTGDILTYNSSSALWTNSKSLSGSYTITGSLTATATISGSTGSFASLSAYGPNQSIQYNGSNTLVGSSNLTFDGTQVRLTGSMQVVSSSTAVVELLSTGIRTTGKPIQVRNISTAIVAVMDENGIVSGSIARFGNVTGSVITSSAFVGDGTLITNIQGNNVKPVGDTWSIQFKNSDGTLTGSSNLLLSSSNFLQISNSGIVYPNIKQNVNFSVNNTDYIIFASGSALTGTLPASVSGRIVKIYNYGATNVYITGSGISGFVGPTGNNIPDFILTTNPRSRDFLYFSDTGRWLII